MALVLGWAAVPYGDGVHVIPLRDLIEHEPEECVCGPRVEAVFNEEEECVGWLYTHHSLDGREGAE